MADETFAIEPVTEAAKSPSRRDRQIAELDQTIACYQLRSKSRMSYAEIGKRLHISKAAAFRRVRRGLRLYGREVTDEFRVTMQTRLEGMLQSIYPRVIAGDLAAVKVALQILKQEADLTGIEAPKAYSLTLTDDLLAVLPTQIVDRIAGGADPTVAFIEVLMHAHLLSDAPVLDAVPSDAKADGGQDGDIDVRQAQEQVGPPTVPDISERTEHLDEVVP